MPSAYAILREMNPERSSRAGGGEVSTRSGLRELSASLLEAAGPLSLLGAQAIYLVEPFFPSRRGRLRAFARILEDPERVRQWIESVRLGEGI